MINVYFDSGISTEKVATFETEELYMACLPALEKEAEKQGMKVFESIDEEYNEKTL